MRKIWKLGSMAPGGEPLSVHVRCIGVPFRPPKDPFLLVLLSITWDHLVAKGPLVIVLTFIFFSLQTWFP